MHLTESRGGSRISRGRQGGGALTFSVADPGYPRGEGANSKGGCEKLLFGQLFPQKLHEIETIWTPGGTSLAPP